MLDRQSGVKVLTVKKLKELLAQIPEDNFIEVNSVGNLLITDSFPFNRHSKNIGYVDFHSEVVEIYI